MKELNILKVAGKSSVSSVSGSIVKSIESGRDVEIRCIGASSINQAVKSLATARGILASQGHDLLVKPGFSTTEINGEPKTMIVFKVIIA